MFTVKEFKLIFQSKIAIKNKKLELNSLEKKILHHQCWCFSLSLLIILLDSSVFLMYVLKSSETAHYKCILLISLFKCKSVSTQTKL